MSSKRYILRYLVAGFATLVLAILISLQVRWRTAPDVRRIIADAKSVEVWCTHDDSSSAAIGPVAFSSETVYWTELELALASTRVRKFRWKSNFTLSQSVWCCHLIFQYSTDTKDGQITSTAIIRINHMGRMECRGIHSFPQILDVEGYSSLFDSIQAIATKAQTSE